MPWLTYNLVNYVSDDNGVESLDSSRNSTTVCISKRVKRGKRSTHTGRLQHPAFQTMTPEPSEGEEA
jgi:hypothetical protein